MPFRLAFSGAGWKSQILGGRCAGRSVANLTIGLSLRSKNGSNERSFVFAKENFSQLDSIFAYEVLNRVICPQES